MAWYGKNSAHELHIGDGRAFHCIVFYKINFSRKHVEQSFPNHFGISPLQERGSQSLFQGRCFGRRGVELACGFVCRFSRCLNTSVAECFVFRSLELHEHLLRVFNLMLEDGHVEEGWKQIMFSMIAITGDPTNPGNWRPLAIPNITTHIFFLLVWFTNV